MRTPLSQPLMCVVAPRRSGHHAFIEWFCERRDKPTVFFNNVRPTLPPAPDRLVIFPAGEAQSHDAPESFLKALRRRDFSFFSDPGHYFLFNYEGISLANILKHQSALEKATGSKLVLFLRDPLNNFASLAKRIRTGQSRNTFQVYAQVLAFCDYVEGLQDGADPFDDIVLYSAWVSDEDYRKALADRYRLRDHAANGAVPEFGGGSSFGGLVFDPIRERDSLFRRWQDMKDDALYLSFFADDHVVACAERYFALFGDREPVSGADLAELRHLALGNDKAKRLSRIWLRGFQRLRRELIDIEAESISILRKLRRNYLRGRIFGSHALADVFAQK